MKLFLGNFFRHLAIFFWSHWTCGTKEGTKENRFIVKKQAEALCGPKTYFFTNTKFHKTPLHIWGVVKRTKIATVTQSPYYLTRVCLSASKWFQYVLWFFSIPVRWMWTEYLFSLSCVESSSIQRMLLLNTKTQGNRHLGIEL